MDTLSPTASQVLRRCRAITAKHSSLALGLWGEAGTGKTYTAQSLLKQLPCQSFSFHSTLPLPSVLQTLPRAPKTPLWAATSLERLAAGETLELARQADALAALLSALAPLVIHFEDVHEASAERRELIRSVARRVKRSPGVGLLITSRNTPPEPFEAVRLQPLSQAAAEELLEQEIGVPPLKEVSTWIYERTQGNPLYTLEYFRYLARAGYLWSDGRRWHWRDPPEGLMPVTVEALIERLIRQAQHSELDHRVLEARALLPTAISKAAWQKTARVSPDELQAAIRNLARQGIFARDTFAHPLFKEVVLKTLTAERRRHFSRRAIGALHDDPELAALFVEDAALKGAQALELFKAAAEQSQDKVRAARFLARAANHAVGEERGKLALEAARRLRATSYPEATRLAEVAVAALPEPAEAALLLTELLALQGRVAEAENELKHLPEHMRLRQRIHLHALAEDHQGVLELWRELAEAAPDGGLAAEVAAALIAYGDFAAAFALASGALAASCHPAQQSRLRGVLATVSHYQGRPQEAVALWNEQIAQLREAGPSAELAGGLKRRAEVFQSLGLLQRKREDLEEAARIYEALGNGHNVAVIRTLLGVLFIEEGEYALAEEALLESRETLVQLGVWNHLIHCERMLCYLYHQLTLPHGAILALKYGRSALERARERGNPQLLANTLYEVSCAETLAGSPRRGLALAEEGLTISKTLDYPQVSIYCRFNRALALEKLGRLEEASCDYRASLEEAETLGLNMDAETIGLELDRIAGDARSAARRLAWLEAHGHQRRAETARAYFPELSDTAPTPFQSAPLPRLEVLGPMRLKNENDSEVRPLRGRKRKALLTLLLEARIAGRSEVSRLALLEALYPEEDEVRASSSLKELVHGLRAGLSAALIVTTANGYALGACATDAEQFLKAPDTSLWRGPYLDGIESEESPVRESLYLALHHQAQALFEADPKEAARVGRLLIEAEPYSTDYLRTYLCALRKLNNHRSLARQYLAARQRLLEVGEALPLRWQAFLA